MTARRGHVIASGVISTLILLSGITLCVLLYELVRKAVEAVAEESGVQQSSSDVSDAAFKLSGPFWLIGFAFIIPGLTGVLGAVIRQKGLFITNMVFLIISLVVMGIFFICGILVLAALAASGGKHCKVIAGSCQCRNSIGEYSSIGLKNCDAIDEVYGFGVAVTVIIVLAWILELTDSIITGILACRSEYQHPGVIIQQGLPTGTVVHMAPVAGMVGVASHDRAVLVQNAQY